MTNQHPITTPPELVDQWYRESDDQFAPYYVYIATQAAQWGADQELEECWRWMRDEGYRETAQLLHAARRPKPPSLKEQALEQLGCIHADLNKFGMGVGTDAIRRALEALPND